MYQPPSRKPCPFCGGTNIDRNCIGKEYWLYCKTCRAFGPAADNIIGAVEAWNRRKEEPHGAEHAL